MGAFWAVSTVPYQSSVEASKERAPAGVKVDAQRGVLALSHGVSRFMKLEAYSSAASLFSGARLACMLDFVRTPVAHCAVERLHQ